MRRLVFILLLLPVLAGARQPFVHDLWLNESNTGVKVNALVQDVHGYLWLGTDAGLYRYNGRSFVYIPDNIHKPVTAVDICDKKVIVGYVNGKVGKVINNTVQPLFIRSVAPASTIRDISCNGEVLFLSTEEGIFGVIDNTGFVLNMSNGLSDNFTYTLADLPGAGMLVGTDHGIDMVRLQNNGVTIDTFLANTSQGLPDDIVRVIKKVDDKNNFWIGTQEGGIVNLRLGNDGTPTWINKSVTWKWGQINDILPISETKAWVATESGYLLDVTMDKDSLIISPENIGKSIKKMVLGNSGAIWCATQEGLTMVTAEFASYIKVVAPYSLNNLTTMLCSNDNKLWFAEGQALYRIALNDSLAIPELIFKAPAAITCMSEDTGYGIWIGTFGKGVYFLKGKNAVPIDNINGLNNSSILSLTNNKDYLWIASLNGVEQEYIVDREEGRLAFIKHHNKQSGIGSDYVYQLTTDHKGHIWMATDGGGIAMFDGNEYHRWGKADGVKSKVVYTIAEDAKGNIWAGTLDDGLYVFDGKRWNTIDRKRGLQDINISSVMANKTGQVIVVNQKGIDEWYPNSRQFRHFNRRMMMDIDSVSAVLNCCAKDTSGNVYIPFEHGFLVFNNLDSNYDIIPQIHITGISLFLKPVPMSAAHSLNYDENYISFSFDGISYANSESLHYRYKLSGYNNTWIKTDDESVTFPNLPPGKYSFHVQSSLSNDFDSSTEAVYSFVIATPFWRQYWFIGSGILAVLLLAYGYIRLREARLRNMSRLQRERMVFEYEHLKSQVNPHFLFNSLNTLTSLIEEDKETAIVYTTQLSDLYRHMLAYKDKDLIFLSEEWEILSNYMYIQKSRFGEALRLETNIPDKLMRIKRIVPLSLQIVVENAIKHNIVSLSNPLTIYISANEEEITIRNPLQPKISKEKGAGLGLINIRKRYVLLTKKEVIYGIKNNEFIVMLPLL